MYEESEMTLKKSGNILHNFSTVSQNCAKKTLTTLFRPNIETEVVHFCRYKVNG